MNAAASVVFLCCGILLCGMLKRVDVFSTFTKGASEGLRSTVDILPSLIGLMVMTTAFRSSGLADMITSLLSPIANRLGIPSQLLPLILLRPASGSGALSFYQSLLEQFGADSLIGRLGGVIQGCGETVFYVTALYFGAIGGKKSGVAVFCALVGNFAGIAVALWYMEKFF